MRGLASFFLFLSLLSAELTVYQEQEIPFPDLFIARGFTPTDITVAPGPLLFLLDRASRQISLIPPGGKPVISGGFGRSPEAMFDPVDVAVSELEVVVVDRMENKLLRYDLRLNYLGSETIQLEDLPQPFYPEKVVADSWSNLYIYSSLNRYLWKRAPLGFESLPFLDLNQEPVQQHCLQELTVLTNDDVALLYPCTKEILVYNRLGRLKRRWHSELTGVRFILAYQNDLILLDKNGTGESLSRSLRETFQLPVDAISIQDAALLKDRLFVLTSRNILVFRLAFAE
jgi:hypothetical protein